MQPQKLHISRTHGTHGNTVDLIALVWRSIETRNQVSSDTPQIKPGTSAHCDVAGGLANAESSHGRLVGGPTATGAKLAEKDKVAQVPDNAGTVTTPTNNKIKTIRGCEAGDHIGVTVETPIQLETARGGAKHNA